MTIPDLARVAGEAFSMITGVDIAYEDLEVEWPASSQPCLPTTRRMKMSTRTKMKTSRSPSLKQSTPGGSLLSLTIG